MYTLNVEKRDLKVKAKRLRKDGLVPCSISDGKTGETILIQIQEGEVKRLLKNKGKGGKAALNCDGQTFNVIIKNIVANQLNNQIENITFQLLNENEYVSSYARVILKNRDKLQAMVYQSVPEIPYKALPQDLIEEIEIDLANVKRGSGLALKDLSIWNNKKLKFTMKEETAIINVS